MSKLLIIPAFFSMLLGSLLAAEPSKSATISATLDITAEESEQFAVFSQRAEMIAKVRIDALRLKLRDPASRMDAIRLLAATRDPAVLDDLTPYLDSFKANKEEMILTMVALAPFRQEAITATLRKLTAHTDEAIRTAAVNAVLINTAWIKDDAKPLIAQTEKSTVVLATVEVGKEKIAELGAKLVSLLRNDRRPFVRLQAAIGLGKLGDEALAGQALITALTDPHPAVRQAVAESLLMLGHKPAIPYMIQALHINVAGVAINRCLMALAGHDFGYNPYASLADREQVIRAAFDWWTLQQKKP
jgi:HEAT repeat protein